MSFFLVPSEEEGDAERQRHLHDFSIFDHFVTPLIYLIAIDKHLDVVVYTEMWLKLKLLILVVPSRSFLRWEVGNAKKNTLHSGREDVAVVWIKRRPATARGSKGVGVARPFRMSLPGQKHPQLGVLLGFAPSNGMM